MLTAARAARTFSGLRLYGLIATWGDLYSGLTGPDGWSDAVVEEAGGGVLRPIARRSKRSATPGATSRVTTWSSIELTLPKRPEVVQTSSPTVSPACRDCTSRWRRRWLNTMNTMSSTGRAKISRLAVGEPPLDMEHPFTIGWWCAQPHHGHARVPSTRPGDRPSVGDTRHTDQRAPP